MVAKENRPCLLEIHAGVWALILHPCLGGMAKRRRDVCRLPESERRIDAANFPAHTSRMAKKISGAKTSAATSERGVHAVSASGLQEPSKRAEARAPKPAKPSALLDTRVVYCGDNLEQLAKLPDACVDLIYIDPPKPMQKEKCRIMKPARFPILHSSFILLPLPYYHCDWHASHYAKVMLDQIFGEN
jgi:hypothetical protein